MRWSAQSDKHDANVTRLKWRSFEPNRIGAGMIFWHAQKAGFSDEAFSIELVTSAAEFLALPLPPREPIIDALLFKQSIDEVVGWRGCGKTWFGLSMAKAIAQGSQFLAWPVPQRRRVLYVDGEMAGRELQDRMRAIFGPSVPELFELMASEIFYRATDSSLAINHVDQQVGFEGLLKALAAADRAPEVIIFDNLSALTAGLDENSSTEFQGLKAWFTRLRHMGYTVIFVHHSGKSGDQRGTSAREDNLDMTIHLSEPEQQHKDDLTRIEMKIGKCRGERPKPDAAAIALVRDRSGILELAISTAKPKRNSSDIEQKYWVLKFIAQNRGITRSHVAEKFDLAKSTAKEHVQKLIKEQLVAGAAGPLEVTPAGRSKIGRLWPEEEQEM
jgi:KaiC/GvpD/RAD55 family RecA-like ATPase